MNPHRTPGVLDPCPGCSRSMARLRVYFRATGCASPEFCSGGCLNAWFKANPEARKARAAAREDARTRVTNPRQAIVTFALGAARAAGAFVFLTAFAFAVGWIGCHATPRDAAVTAANVLHAGGHTGNAVLDTCTAIVVRERATRARAAEEEARGGPPPLVRSTAEHEAVLRACDEVERVVEMIRTTHEALRQAVLLAEEVERTGGVPDWSDVSRLVAEGLATAEALRQAVATAQEVLR